ncbi:MAG: sugar ABC transporter substrate-binding protein [Aquabacterium commune]|uniref:sugar ABC transporter substrate-binding protein n=1 Tax=Aquabacterium commune TaxID=70586 RepID=UPI003BB1259A
MIVRKKQSLFWSTIAAIVALTLLVTLSKLFLNDQGKKQIYVFLPSIENPFWLDVRDGVAREAAQLGDAFDVKIVTTASTDGSDQIDQMSTAIARGRVDGIVLAPTNDRAPAPVVARLNKRGIKVVLIDTDLNADTAKQVGATWDAFIGSDNRLGGEMAARVILDALKDAKGSKSVLLLKGNYVHQSAVDRAEGFVRAASPEMRVIERSAEWSRQTANELTASQFSREPVNAIFASNDDMALGAVSALKKLNIPPEKWPVVVGFDATKDAQTAIREGAMHGSIRQQSSKMGASGLRKAADLVQGAASSSSTEKTLVPVDVVTKLNLP